MKIEAEFISDRNNEHIRFNNQNWYLQETDIPLSDTELLNLADIHIKETKMTHFNYAVNRCSIRELLKRMVGSERIRMYLMKGGRNGRGIERK